MNLFWLKTFANVITFLIQNKSELIFFLNSIEIISVPKTVANLYQRENANRGPVVVIQSFNISTFLTCMAGRGFRGVAGCLFCNHEEEKIATTRRKNLEDFGDLASGWKSKSVDVKLT